MEGSLHGEFAKKEIDGRNGGALTEFEKASQDLSMECSDGLGVCAPERKSAQSGSNDGASEGSP